MLVFKSTDQISFGGKQTHERKKIVDACTRLYVSTAAAAASAVVARGKNRIEVEASTQRQKYDKEIYIFFIRFLSLHNYSANKAQIHKRKIITIK